MGPPEPARGPFARTSGLAVDLDSDSNLDSSFALRDRAEPEAEASSARLTRALPQCYLFVSGQLVLGYSSNVRVISTTTAMMTTRAVIATERQRLGHTLLAAQCDGALVEPSEGSADRN